MPQHLIWLNILPKNGVPIEEDVNWGYDSRYEIVQTPILENNGDNYHEYCIEDNYSTSVTHLESLDFIRL